MCHLTNCSFQQALAHFGHPLFKSWLKAASFEKVLILYDWLTLQIGNMSKILHCDWLMQLLLKFSSFCQAGMCGYGNHRANLQYDFRTCLDTH